MMADLGRLKSCQWQNFKGLTNWSVECWLHAIVSNFISSSGHTAWVHFPKRSYIMVRESIHWAFSCRKSGELLGWCYGGVGILQVCGDYCMVRPLWLSHNFRAHKYVSWLDNLYFVILLKVIFCQFHLIYLIYNLRSRSGWT